MGPGLLCFSCVPETSATEAEGKPPLEKYFSKLFVFFFLKESSWPAFLCLSLPFNQVPLLVLSFMK